MLQPRSRAGKFLPEQEGGQSEEKLGGLGDKGLRGQRRGMGQKTSEKKGAILSYPCFPFYSWTPLSTVKYLLLNKPTDHGYERHPKTTRKVNDSNLQRLDSGSKRWNWGTLGY
jgi:hypothetical protein